MCALVVYYNPVSHSLPHTSTAEDDEEAYRKKIASDREKAARKKRKTISAEQAELARSTGLSGQVVALMAGHDDGSDDEDDATNSDDDGKKRKKKSSKKHMASWTHVPISFAWPWPAIRSLDYMLLNDASPVYLARRRMDRIVCTPPLRYWTC